MTTKQHAPSGVVVDVHTHLYFPRYIQMMRDRKVLPYVTKVQEEERLLILADDEKMGGRPIHTEYYDVDEKKKWMQRHEIDHAILSLANPWLDFLQDSNESALLATQLNQDLEQICVDHPKTFSGFGVLPLQTASGAVAEIHKLANLPHIKGVIMGTAGLGKGLDDPALDEVWRAIQEKNMVVFVHPHYGVGGGLFDGYGHSLHLALGFPFETTTAIAKLVLSGVLERFPDLHLLLAHSGGTLPFLAGRIDSCVLHDEVAHKRLPKPPSHYLRKIYYDALSYHEPGVACTAKFVGTDQMMFGTDHPFSISDPFANYKALSFLDSNAKDDILHENAESIFKILLK